MSFHLFTETFLSLIYGHLKINLQWDYFLF